MTLFNLLAFFEGLQDDPCAVAPDVRPMFKEDTTLQEKKLIGTITYVVPILTSSEALVMI